MNIVEFILIVFMFSWFFYVNQICKKLIRFTLNGFPLFHAEMFGYFNAPKLKFYEFLRGDCVIPADGQYIEVLRKKIVIANRIYLLGFFLLSVISIFYSQKYEVTPNVLPNSVMRNLEEKHYREVANLICCQVEEEEWEKKCLKETVSKLESVEKHLGALKGVKEYKNDIKDVFTIYISNQDARTFKDEKGIVRKVFVGEYSQIGKVFFKIELIAYNDWSVKSMAIAFPKSKENKIIVDALMTDLRPDGKFILPR